MAKIEWILCPVCGNKTRNRIREDTILKTKKLQVTVIEDIDKKRDDKER